MSRDAVVIDIETTGEDKSSDRICSLSLISIVNGEVHPNGQLYLLFDPGQESSPEASARHEMSDWVLRHQSPFSDYAERLQGLLEKAPLVVGHDIARKMHFINKELDRAGVERVRPHGFCTRDAAARRWPQESPTLEACLARLGIKRKARQHGASEDSAMTAALFLYFQGNAKPDIRYASKPHNLRPSPPAPDPVPPRQSASS